MSGPGDGKEHPCPHLVCLHMSDMGISRDKELQDDILEMFGIFDEDEGNVFNAVLKKA